jgi:transcriptional regulator with XRE-family HTH domain
MTSAELRALRLSLGLTFREAARRCDVAERSYARWESGERAVPEGVDKRLRAKK